MTVKELINKLKQFNPNSAVLYAPLNWNYKEIWEDTDEGVVYIDFDYNSITRKDNAN